MSGSGILGEMEAVKALARILSTCARVNRYDQESEPEAWTLALAFRDIEESTAKIYNEFIPKLLSADHSSDEIYNVLIDIGEELRHVLYHIRDPQFFRYLE